MYGSYNFSTIGIPIAVLIIILKSIGLYCKCFEMKTVVYVNTLD